MLKNIPHRRRLLRKNFRLPHQRNRYLNKKIVIKKSNKPYIIAKKNNNDDDSLFKPKKKYNANSYKMAYRYRYYKIIEENTDDELN